MRTTIATMCLMLACGSAWAVKVADVTHMQGQRENKLVGLGLVVGLAGTGDGGNFTPPMRQLAAFLQNFNSDISTLEELKATKNIAIVTVEAVIADNGAREGQRLDVAVSAFGSAKSLKGGRLLLCPLFGPNPMDTTVYALAGGPISVDRTTATTGTIGGGATMEQNVINTFITAGQVTLVINDAHASWAMASAIAMTINEAVSVLETDVHLAKAIDPKNVIVSIPAAEQNSPASFISYVQSLPLLTPEKQARVTVNSRQGTLVIDGAVTISPVTVTYRGMTVSTKSLTDQQKQAAPGEEEVDKAESESVELRLLTESLEMLKAPFEDRVAIIRELARSGNLQGQLVEEQ